ncbi:Metallo-hydrolase/oxidoreductase [Mycena belliarum]|uniref:Metallo-hydrolase/oxidoreductase n=1 Tax=Mycena belliarum TaxID=1033014 RepID=A0AAD6XM93_9AGAR|nr:Metallo-hydrolase/oxidoreductase [Mycena belliae]
MSEPLRLHPSPASGSPDVYSFFEPDTSTWQYIVSDPATKDAALIDTVLDYDPSSGKISTATADQIVSFVGKHGLNVKYVLETHAHADHLTAAQYFKKKFDIPVGIGKRISAVQETFAPVYGYEPSAFVGAFDLLFRDDQTFSLGSLNCRVIHLPGHTPDHVGYIIGQSVFTGDSIFQPDIGSARSDFPGGDAKALHSSLRRLMALPETFSLFVGHDYPTGRQQFCASTVGQHLKSNKHLAKGISESEFIALRNARDAGLGAPRLLHPALQTNIRGGRLPTADHGRPYFKIPITTSVAL